MSTPDDLTTYGELADVVELVPLLVRENRRRRSLSLRAAADELGYAPTTIRRIENEEGYNVRLLPDLLRWLESVPERA